MDDVVQRQRGHLGGAAADVDGQVAVRLLDRQAGTERRGERLLHQIDAVAARGFGLAHQRLHLDRGRAVRHADDHRLAAEVVSARRFADVVAAASARAASKLAMTPSLSGRMTSMNSGARPSIVRARSPKAIASPVDRLMATADGSRSRMPFSWV